MAIDRRQFLQGLAALFSPVSSIGEPELLRLVDNAAGFQRFSDLSLDAVFEAVFFTNTSNSPIKVVPKNFFNAQAFSGIVRNTGIHKVEIFERLHAMGVTPANIIANKEEFLRRAEDVLSPVYKNALGGGLRLDLKLDQIGEAIDALRAVADMDYLQVAELQKQKVRDYVATILRHEGGKDVVTEGLKRLSRSELEYVLKQLTELPDDIAKEIKDKCTSWSLKEVGASGRYFRIVVSDKIPIEQRDNVCNEAITQCRKRIDSSFMIMDDDVNEMKVTKVGQEYWIWASNARSGDVLRKECLDNTVFIQR